MSSLRCSLLQFIFVILHYELINDQPLNKSFNPIAPLNSIYFLISIYFNKIIVL